MAEVANPVVPARIMRGRPGMQRPDMKSQGSFRLNALKKKESRRGGFAKEQSFRLNAIVGNSSFNSKGSNDGSFQWGERSVKFSAKNFVSHNGNDKKLDEAYDIGAMLGEGGFGEVYACTHIESGAERAVKIMEKQGDDEDNEKIVQEFNTVKELDHPNILKLYELFEDDKFFYIVSDVYKGGELYDEMMEFTKFSEDDTAILMNNLLSCINYCHKKNVVHRDLKPENILLEETKAFDDMKIIDFGLADKADENHSELRGSTYYMAPQVIEGNYGAKCDVWSCGIIAYVCLSGYAPFDGNTDLEVMNAVVQGNFDFDDEAWEDISDDAKDFIEQLLAYDEADRPSAGDALKHPWLQSIRKRDSATPGRRASSRMSLTCMKQFQANSKLKQAVCSMIASQFLKKKEKDEIDSVFRSLDIDCDGKLTPEDVRESYKSIFDQELSDGEIRLMFKHVNFSGSGAIEYSEFVVASLMEKKLIDDQKLRAAFAIFDQDDKGYISTGDIQRVLALDDGMEDYIIHKVIKQVDLNGDGKICFDEFTKMMFSNQTLASSMPDSTDDDECNKGFGKIMGMYVEEQKK